MGNAIRSWCDHFLGDEEGATLVEYGIAIVLALSVATALLVGVAGQISTNMNEANSLMTTP